MKCEPIKRGEWYVCRRCGWGEGIAAAIDGPFHRRCRPIPVTRIIETGLTELEFAGIVEALDPMDVLANERKVAYVREFADLGDNVDARQPVLSKLLQELTRGVQAKQASMMGPQFFN